MIQKNKYLSEIYLAIRRSFFLLLLPAFEILFLRFYLHKILSVQLGWAYITDFDFFIPGPVAFSIYILALSQKMQPRFKFNEIVFSINILSIVNFLILNHYFDRLSVINSELFIVFWILNFFIIVISAFNVFISSQFYLKNPNRYLLLPILLILLCPLFARRVLSPFWTSFSFVTGKWVCSLLSLTLPSPVQCVQALNFEPRMVIHYPQQSASIGRGCGGLDSFALFSYCALILVSLKPTLFKWWRWVSFWVFGLFLMFCLNILRIAGFFYFAIFLKNIFGVKASVDVFVNLFHTHVGWVLYTASFLIYFLLCVRVEAFFQRGAWKKMDFFKVNDSSSKVEA